MEASNYALVWLTFVGLSECFILEGVSPAHGILSPTTMPDRCDIGAFDNCSKSFMSIMNQTENGLVIDQDRLKNFYCGTGNEYEKTLKCWKQNIDPTCGPDTYAASLNTTFSLMPTDNSFLYKYCRNLTDFTGLMTCQSMLPKVDGFVKCITGETLNKTIDPSDTCNLLTTSVGCTYKYTKLMCPEFLSTYIESANSAGNCASNYDKTPEVTSCDEDMMDACSEAFKPPSFTNSTQDEMYQFICNGRSLKYTQCLHQVADMCKNKHSFDSSNQTIDLKQFELQKQVLCSNDTENKQLQKCQGLFPKLDAYRECLVGKNFLFNYNDACRLFEDGLGCSLKYTDLMCPEYLDAFNRTISVKSDCKQDIDISNVLTSCDTDIETSCNVAYSPPDKDNLDLYEDFICSGRAKEYATCLQKVDNLCSSSNIDNVTVFQFTPSSGEQIHFICSHKTGYRDFIRCFNNYTTSQSHLKCISTDHSNVTCRDVKCNLNSIDKFCPFSLAFYKMLNQKAIDSCGLQGTISIPMIVSSARNIYLSFNLLLPVLVTYLLELFI